MFIECIGNGRAAHVFSVRLIFQDEEKPHRLLRRAPILLRIAPLRRIMLEVNRRVVTIASCLCRRSALPSSMRRYIFTSDYFLLRSAI